MSYNHNRADWIIKPRQKPTGSVTSLYDTALRAPSTSQLCSSAVDECLGWQANLRGWSVVSLFSVMNDLSVPYWRSVCLYMAVDR